MSVPFNPQIFREYDIRGIAERDLSDPVIEELGRSFAEHAGRRDAAAVAIGYDARESSPRLRDALARGILAAGIDVVDIGLCPTPALYFSLHHLSPGAGIMITGSHNPAEFNGFKLCIGRETIHGEAIQELRKAMDRRQQNGRSAASLRGTYTNHPILPDYIRDLEGRFPAAGNGGVDVVLDAGNGTAGLAAPAVMRSMGCRVTELYSEPDGRFPNHHPDPTVPKNLETLIRTVRERKADLGIAFDGDGDRIGVVDEQGGILWGDQLMVLFSRDILAERPGATFVSEVKCSQVMYDDIRKHGGKAVMWKTGHSLIKAKMKETGAAMAGEMSGHLFFADRYYGFDDAVYAACRTAELLMKTRKRTGTATALSSLLADLPRTFSTPEIRFDCPDDLKFRVVEGMRQLYDDRKGLAVPPREVITVDGIRAVFRSGWGLLRASNTQPVLVMRFEAEDETSLHGIRSLMEEQVRQVMAQLS